MNYQFNLEGDCMGEQYQNVVDCICDAVLFMDIDSCSAIETYAYSTCYVDNCFK